ncbi:hypothetical protein TRFO_22237 [Tritrichomonas foetus]|uniref:Uncharacterized protein n=1 Tax=Tritrichomonas foetus TaxID=1144522 RepID=A0A1J4KC58_9EUKA|nr:hypothetical protein TRFO_22237 [Tritrichomonas foetus]|eukprot:OHT08999.1 hypothetical protein TRFO_22237 [Tritrichomonas foetus]
MRRSTNSSFSPNSSINRFSNQYNVRTNPRSSTSLRSSDPSPLQTSRRSKKKQLFQPQASPRTLTGPVFYYREIDKIDKIYKRDFDSEMKRKEIKKQMHSPYKENFVRLRAESVKSTRRQISNNEREWIRKRAKDNQSYENACQEEYDSERRHCQIDYINPTHKELRVLGI